MTNYKEKDNMGTKVVAKTKPTPNFDLKEPLQYKVIYINDEVTTMDFVIMSLITVFNHSPEMAQSLCDEVHEKGAGTAAIMPYEMAEQKGVEVTQLARNAGFPLQIKLEPTE
jgi:ATP-dependent Clp protease adaptor protein ClpS|tara:strand:+ start:1382 stop:1717 length:336 start_codon:yes stop_codon:yes gene_type:complete